MSVSAAEKAMKLVSECVRMLRTSDGHRLIGLHDNIRDLQRLFGSALDIPRKTRMELIHTIQSDPVLEELVFYYM